VEFGGIDPPVSILTKSNQIKIMELMIDLKGFSSRLLASSYSKECK